jgi:hypothetical protein
MRFLFATLLLGASSMAHAVPPVRLPTGETLARVDFERHVAPLLGKFGCSAGACHGSFQGKGGLRLSLFGHDPAMDFKALTRDALGRRIDKTRPEHSLMLLKPTARITHEGGKRFAAGSWAEEVIRAWIADGARHRPGSGQVRRLVVEPRELGFNRPHESQTLRVRVEFTDGTCEDLTPLCDFRAADDSIAEVSPVGVVRGQRPGDTPIVIAYRGELTTVRVFVPVSDSAAWSEPPAENFIDRQVLAKLRRLRLPTSELACDEEFLRRVSIDVIGALPAPDDVRRFLADSRPDKRMRKIEKLLVHPWHAALWATRLCDVTGCNIETMDGPPENRSRRAKMWHDWFRVRIAANERYDRIVHGVLCATSREGKDVERWIRQEADLEQALQRGFDTPYASRPTLDLFWRRFSGDEYFPPEQMAERIASAFLGVRVECAQCHKHPFDRWTQADYRSFANVFAQVHHGSAPETTAAVVAFLERRRQFGDKAGPPLPRVQEVYISSHRPRLLPNPQNGAALPARALGGPEIPLEGDAREGLFRWLDRPDNSFFARAFVNRVWAHYMGRGLVEPVDNFSVANPPSNEPLLQALAADFVEHSYDLRRLERLILTSRTYQLSSRPNAANAADRTNYSHARARPMLAEVVVDVLSDALGVPEDLGPDAPPGRRAIEVATNRVRAPHLARMFRIFGRPPRSAACDCERPAEAAVPQTLFLMTDSLLLRNLKQGRLAKLLAEKRADEEVIEELFLASLSRLPEAAEKQAALDHLCAAADRKGAFTDIFWALINTREFMLNH